VGGDNPQAGKAEAAAKPAASFIYGTGRTPHSFGNCVHCRCTQA
jgi:hypothetical protein